jgi:hypothetical protein
LRGVSFLTETACLRTSRELHYSLSPSRSLGAIPAAALLLHSASSYPNKKGLLQNFLFAAVPLFYALPLSGGLFGVCIIGR